MSALSEMQCVACRADSPQATDEEIAEYQKQVPEWELYERNGIKRIRRAFRFKNFAEALAFTNAVGQIAEEQGHHPTIRTEWGRVTVTTYTHAIKGLHQNDFILAAKADEQYEQQTSG